MNEKELVFNHLEIYKTVLQEGIVPKVYKALLKYMHMVRNELAKNYPDDFYIGKVYEGAMDISYVSCTSSVLQQEKLKVVLVLNHEELQFEIWLCGQNKQVQRKYWELFQGSDWNSYPITPNADHAIMKHIVVAHPNFNEKQLLLKEIEEEIITFNKEIAKVLT